MAHRREPASRALPGERGRWRIRAAWLTGAAALLWVLIRSGVRPSRLVYPCQRAALATAVATLGAPLLVAVAASRRWMSAVRRSRALASCAVLLLAGLVLTTARLSRAVVDPPMPLEPPVGHRPQVFHVAGCPLERSGDSFPGLEVLLRLMGRGGLKLYRSPHTGELAGPEGLFGTDDVIVVKINYQWPERGGTNTDLLWGLIHRLLSHPDGFAGEVVVCENAQFAVTDRFDRASNNAHDHHQSPADAVARFRDAGHRVSFFDWTTVRRRQVGEYEQGDQWSGYIVSDWVTHLGGRPSYPKFETDYGTRISLARGVWDGGAYDRTRLKVVNLPVLKSHAAEYGATACVKNWMGVVTDTGTNSHDAIRSGLLGAVMAATRPPDLNLLDCLWTSSDPRSGPRSSYATATRTAQLVASTDPIAADIWAVSNILVPAFLANGNGPPWPTPSVDPDDPESDFRQYLDRSMGELLAAGFAVSNDLSRIDAVSASASTTGRPRRSVGRVAADTSSSPDPP